MLMAFKGSLLAYHLRNLALICISLKLFQLCQLSIEYIDPTTIEPVLSSYLTLLDNGEVSLIAVREVIRRIISVQQRWQTKIYKNLVARFRVVLNTKLGVQQQQCTQCAVYSSTRRLMQCCSYICSQHLQSTSMTTCNRGLGANPGRGYCTVNCNCNFQYRNFMWTLDLLYVTF